MFGETVNDSFLGEAPTQVHPFRLGGFRLDSRSLFNDSRTSFRVSGFSYNDGIGVCLAGGSQITQREEIMLERIKRNPVCFGALGIVFFGGIIAQTWMGWAF